MTRVINWFKNIRPFKVLSVFLAGMFLILTQACSGANATQPSQQPGAESAYTKRYDPTKEYNLNAPEGGMNNFSDNDPRAKNFEKAAQNRADDLSRNAERNINEKGVESPGDYARNYRQGTPFPERVKNLGEDIGSSVEGTAEGVAKGSKRGIENLKENTSDAAQNLGRNAQRQVENDRNAIKQTLNKD